MAAVEEAVRSWPGGMTKTDRERLFKIVVGQLAPRPDVFGGLASLLGIQPHAFEGVRAAALAVEDDDIEEGHWFWTALLADTAKFAHLRAEDRQIAMALVWERAGDLAWRIGEAKFRTGCQCPACRRHRGKYTEAVKPGALNCYSQAIKLDPKSLDVRRKQVALLRAARREREAVRALEEITQAWPNDVAALLDLGDRACERKAFRKSFSYLERAYKLEPLSEMVLEKLTECLCQAAVGNLVKGRPDLARKDFMRAEGLRGERGLGARYGQWAACELAAGEVAAGGAHLEQALKSTEWPLDVLLDVSQLLWNLGAPPVVQNALALRVEATVQALSLEPLPVEWATKSFCRLSMASPKGKRTWPTGKQCCTTLARFLQGVDDLPFAEPQRLELCHLLASSGEWELARQFAAAGRAQFPSNYHFAVLEAWARVQLAAQSDTHPRLPASLLEALPAAQEAAREAGDVQSSEKLSLILAHQCAEKNSGSFIQALFDFEVSDLDDEEEDEPLESDKTAEDDRAQEEPFAGR